MKWERLKLNMEIKNMHEYNPNWSKDGTLSWKKIGEKTGKNRIRKQKKYNYMDINKIVVPPDIQIDKKVLEDSRHQYEKTHIMIPVYLSYDFELIAGYEQYILAKELGIQEITFYRITKMNKKEARKYHKTVHHRPVCNKKYPIKDVCGNKIYITYAQRKYLNTIFGLARKSNKSIEISPEFKINILNADGTIYKKSINVKSTLKYLRMLQKSENVA